jgi:hypothetical protein
MSSGDFWCVEHSCWNCLCFLPPGSITTSGGGMCRPKHESIEFYKAPPDEVSSAEPNREKPHAAEDNL